MESYADPSTIALLAVSHEYACAVTNDNQLWIASARETRTEAR